MCKWDIFLGGSYVFYYSRFRKERWVLLLGTYVKHLFLKEKVPGGWERLPRTPFYISTFDVKLVLLVDGVFT